MKHNRCGTRIEIAERATLGAIVLAALFCAPRAFALEAFAIRESAGVAFSGAPCALATSTDGTAANYRWYNVCSGYIWIFTSWCDQSAGVLFGGPEQPEVNDQNVVKRAITYWRNVVTNYGQTVDIFLEPDFEGDGCPDARWLSDRGLDPGLRWNCSEFDAPVLSGVDYLIVRFDDVCGAAPTVATDGPFSEACNPNPIGRSYYYGSDLSECIPWIGPSGRSDNFLFWLILDRPAPNAVEPSTWGAIKGLFR
ncbi:MAG: hypothetical protein ACKVU1_17680 [bacterium]